MPKLKEKVEIPVGERVIGFARESDERLYPRHKIDDISKLNFTIPEAAKASGLSVGYLYKKAASRELPGMLKIGNRVLLPVADFERWLSTFRVKK